MKRSPMKRSSTPMKRSTTGLKKRSKKMAKAYKGQTCTMCNGSGTNITVTSLDVTATGRVDVPCFQCGGTGVVGRAELVARRLAAIPTCEAGHVIGRFLVGDELVHRNFPRRATDPIWSECMRDSHDVHELLARSAGGSIFDPSNLLCVCRRCHQWIGDHPKEALALGLRRSRYEGRNL